ncbi:hypothetical protein GY45DRAFT_1341606, partial [Cubamyces sp. BRFM 1775]
MVYFSLQMQSLDWGYAADSVPTTCLPITFLCPHLPPLPLSNEEDTEKEDEGTQRRKKWAKHRHEPPAVDRFLNVEAVVGDDEDEVEYTDEYARDTGLEGEDDCDMVRRAADHARCDRRVREMGDRDLEQVAEDISRRYRQATVRYTGDMSDVPQWLLMPSVHDANLWQVRVR